MRTVVMRPVSPPWPSVPSVIMRPVIIRAVIERVVYAPIAGIIAVRVCPEAPIRSGETPVPPQRVGKCGESPRIRAVHIDIPVERIKPVDYVPIIRAADVHGKTRTVEADDAQGIFVVIHAAAETVHPAFILVTVRIAVFSRRFFHVRAAAGLSSSRNRPRIIGIISPVVSIHVHSHARRVVIHIRLRFRHGVTAIFRLYSL